MTELTWNERPTLRRPLLLIAFEGLFDAAEAATDALGWIRERNDSVQVAEIDGETFYNFVEIRPTVRIAGSGGRVIDWPGARVWAVRTDSVRDLLVMTGTEPQLRWGTFADLILDVARQSGAEMAVTVGAMVSMVPHTRPFTITGRRGEPRTGTPPEPRPTHVRRAHRHRRRDQRTPRSLGATSDVVAGGGSSLRAVAPNPKATRALLRSIQKTTGVPTGYEELDGAVNEWVKRVDQAVGSDEETTNYVARLDARSTPTKTCCRPATTSPPNSRPSSATPTTTPTPIPTTTPATPPDRETQATLVRRASNGALSTKVRDVRQIRSGGGGRSPAVAGGDRR
ncbi:MAG: PAC2 family protein [Acidimicrobiales bacterium]